MDLHPPQFPDDYFAQLNGPHAAALAALDLFTVLRNGGRHKLALDPSERAGVARAVELLLQLVFLDYRDLRAADSDYLRAARLEDAMRLLNLEQDDEDRPA